MKKENEKVVATAPEIHTECEVSLDRKDEFLDFIERLKGKDVYQFMQLWRDNNNLAYMAWDTYEGVIEECECYLENEIEQWFENRIDDEELEVDFKFDCAIVLDKLTSDFLKKYMKKGGDFEYNYVRWCYGGYEDNSFIDYFKYDLDIDDMIDELCNNYLIHLKAENRDKQIDSILNN